MASDPMRWHPDAKTDQRLLDESRHGRAESFEVVYRRHHAVVLAFLARRAQQPELAADLMAETFAALLVLVRDPDRALPPVPVAWLLVTARNLLIDSHRRGCVDDAARRWLGMRPVALDDRDLERVEEISAEVDLLERLASQLEPEQLAALRARVLDEREYSEIAAEMKCSESVVRKRVSRALGVLRRALEVSGNA
jgi:RNA polymerase sigma factor (sigma-70 family)